MKNVTVKHIQRIILEKLISESKKRIIDHNKHDKNSHALKQSREEDHSYV